MTTKIQVTTQIQGKDILAGYLRPSYSSGTFIYDSSYLSNPRAFALAPSLPLEAGPQHFSGLGGFSDSAPDRWGRKLLQRTQGRQNLSEFDYLLGVNDTGRQGAVRFWQEGKACTSDGQGVPTEISLLELLNTAQAIERKDTDLLEVQSRRLFIATGSLGGARPKANVLIGKELWLAKFPKPWGDNWDIMGWEKVTRDLQELAGIRVAPAQSRLMTNDQGDPSRVYLLKRFDRNQEGHRIPYISAMTALEARDGDGGDWLDLLEFAQDQGADTKELWRRLVFNLLVGNTDDHLRNHGFLHQGRSWTLAPSFDVNPTPDDQHHQLALLGNDTYRLEDTLAPELLDACQVSLEDAQEWVRSLGQVFKRAPRLAQEERIDKQSLEIMLPRFEQALETISQV